MSTIYEIIDQITDPLREKLKSHPGRENYELKPDLEPGVLPDIYIDLFDPTGQHRGTVCKIDGERGWQADTGPTCPPRRRQSAQAALDWLLAELDAAQQDPTRQI